MNTFESLTKIYPEIEQKIGYRFNDPALLWLAFTHRSFVNENKHVQVHNERLEFLGDSVLGMVIAEHLYLTLPHQPEGELSYLRSRLVEAGSCVKYIQKLDLSHYLLLGKGERMNDGRGRESILADLFEAIVGAIYLDGGLPAAKKFLFEHFTAEFDGILDKPIHNWKALLQDYCQKKYQNTPRYILEEEAGPDHSKVFKISVFVNDENMGYGDGTSKKEAQQAAAQDALARLKVEV